MQVLGVLFAITFIGFRVVLWPYVSYKFFIDALILLQTNTAHANYVVYTFLSMNIGLTLLQFYWLGEIITTASKLLFNDGQLVLARGDKQNKKND